MAGVWRGGKGAEEAQEADEMELARDGPPTQRATLAWQASAVREVKGQSVYRRDAEGSNDTKFKSKGWREV